MSGFYLLGVVTLLAYVAWRLGGVAVQRISNPWLAKFCQLALAFLLMTLLVADEIVGGYQFEKLCQENSTIQIDRATARGKTVYFDPQPNVEIKGTWVRVVLKPKRFIDVKTRETVVSYNELMAEGGRFINALGISEGGMPLIFSGECVPANRPASTKTFEQLGINYIEPPITRTEK